jgi:hypothetical protein
MIERLTKVHIFAAQLASGVFGIGEKSLSKSYSGFHQTYFL